MTSFVKKKTRKKEVVGIVTFDLIGLLPTNHSIAYIQWHTGVCEETFDVNSKIAETTQSRKSILQEVANFGSYPGDFRL